MTVQKAESFVRTPGWLGINADMTYLSVLHEFELAQIRSLLQRGETRFG